MVARDTATDDNAFAIDEGGIQGGCGVRRWCEIRGLRNCVHQSNGISQGMSANGISQCHRSLRLADIPWEKPTYLGKFLWTVEQNSVIREFPTICEPRIPPCIPPSSIARALSSGAVSRATTSSQCTSALRFEFSSSTR